MKAITLHQPWAMFVAIGAKKIVTPSFWTAYRGPLAIHAGRNTDYLRLVWNDPFYQILQTYFGNLWSLADLPIGAVICTVELWQVDEMTPELIAAVDESERSLGLYEPGRFAWRMRNIKPLAEPVPARGYHGLWNWSEAKGYR